MEDVIEASPEERKWGMIVHLSALLGYVTAIGFILAPLVIWLLKKDESDFIDKNGKEALNFQISMFLYALISIVLIIIVIGAFLLPLIGLLQAIFTIIAAIKANDGAMYRYPLTIRFIK